MLTKAPPPSNAMVKYSSASQQLAPGQNTALAYSRLTKTQTCSNATPGQKILSRFSRLKMSIANMAQATTPSPRSIRQRYLRLSRPSFECYTKQCDYAGQDPLYDPCRHARIKAVHWAFDNTPVLKMTPDQFVDPIQNVTIEVVVK